ncbi:hypothetical protein SAMN02745164_01659 [Marinitoga hydrogenitolerans DSM 16785]|uniref:Uncharacterized protein n=1 Tax=Marinitoga hydrogenitolerans (strain DSM 16785 / JCM 12826 / AT1271) TaxID=1122195 RepID=A0A1M4YE74_MARH1|nr:hypothetical protein [Marinitoga hydrogenitolerans]SHF04077.1 hypothetical protein SAMN02745164_01659 [Marinitoga hydrogenitolerans DSM 16785]
MKKVVYLILFFIILFSFTNCTLKEDKKPIIQLIEPTSNLIDSSFNLKFKISDDIYLKNWEISIDNQIISALKFDRISENEIEVSSLEPYKIDNIPDGKILNIIISAEDNIGNKTSLKKELKVGRKPEIKLLPSENIYDTVEGTFNIQAYIKDIDVESYADIADYNLSISNNDNLIYYLSAPQSVKDGTYDIDATLISTDFNAYDYPIGDSLDLYISVTDRASNTTIYEKSIKIGGEAPIIKILEPNKYSTASTTLTVIAEITDDVEIKDIKLIVNNEDKTVESTLYMESLDSTKLNIDEFKNYSYIKKVYIKNDKIELPLNESIIEIKAEDRAGNTISRGFKIIISTENINSPTKSFKIIKVW